MSLRLVMICLLTCCAWNAYAVASSEDYAEQLAKTDLTSADEVFMLAAWCKEGGLHFSASKHFKQALKIDPDHQPTRDALGYVWYDKRWVHKSRVPGASNPRPATGKGGGRSKPGRPGPSTADVDWDLRLPERSSEPDARWLINIIAEMNTVGNFAPEMEQAWRTLLLPQYLPYSGNELAHALSDPSFTDIYGATQFVQTCLQSDDPAKQAQGKMVYPFVVKASERVTDGEELYYFALVVGQAGDKRAVPRMIDMLDGEGDAQAGAMAALSMLTLIPEDEVTKDRAQTWWNRYHSASDGEIYGHLLKSADPLVRLGACDRLYPEQDPRIVPTLIDICKSDNGPAFDGAVTLLRTISASDWGLAKSELSPDEKAERIERLEEWWDTEGAKFTFVEFRNLAPVDAATSNAQTAETWIRELTSLDQGAARAAQDRLLQAGNDAVPALIDALESSDGIRSAKARDLLRTITKQNFGFEPNRGSKAEREQAVASWKAWAKEQQLL
ncbi:MAG: hypothetical protein PF961_09440 [Planctomycetota bacterium]|jgi:hypothetical protein|nr:hypothetical protein [Planctomycetota bacterium]